MIQANSALAAAERQPISTIPDLKPDMDGLGVFTFFTNENRWDLMPGDSEDEKQAVSLILAYLSSSDLIQTKPQPMPAEGHSLLLTTSKIMFEGIKSGFILQLSKPSRCR